MKLAPVGPSATLIYCGVKAVLGMLALRKRVFLTVWIIPADSGVTRTCILLMPSPIFFSLSTSCSQSNMAGREMGFKSDAGRKGSLEGYKQEERKELARRRM